MRIASGKKCAVAPCIICRQYIDILEIVSEFGVGIIFCWIFCHAKYISMGIFIVVCSMGSTVDRENFTVKIISQSSPTVKI